MASDITQAINAENTDSIISQDNTKESHDSVNAGTSDPTDGRSIHSYKSRYPKDACHEITIEATFLMIMLCFSLYALFLSWAGLLSSIGHFTPQQAITIQKYGYYASAGMLGGITFGMKYFYRVVARGYWNQDRRVWRVMSPFIAMVVGLMTGTLIEANLSNGTVHTMSGASMVAVGFLAGYFSDEAVGKMYEVANVIFGKSAASTK